MTGSLEMYGVAVAGVVAIASALAAGWMFRRMSRRYAGLECELVTHQQELAGAVESLRLALQEVCRDLDALQFPAGAASGAPCATSGTINLSKRSQALRLRRRGETPEQIAASLGIPLQEVTLLLKVHEIVMANVG